LSEHKNLKSLDAYKTASVTHQWQMSRILSCSASDRPTSSASSPYALQTLEVRSVSHSQTSNSAWLNSTETVSKITGLFSGARIDGCIFNFNFGPDDCSNVSKQTKKVLPSGLMIQILIRSMTMLFNNINLKKTRSVIFKL
jgi:hypothetical protein